MSSKSALYSGVGNEFYKGQHEKPGSRQRAASTTRQTYFCSVFTHCKLFLLIYCDFLQLVTRRIRIICKYVRLGCVKLGNTLIEVRNCKNKYNHCICVLFYVKLVSPHKYWMNLKQIYTKWQKLRCVKLYSFFSEKNPSVLSLNKNIVIWMKFWGRHRQLRGDQ